MCFIPYVLGKFIYARSYPIIYLVWYSCLCLQWLYVPDFILVQYITTYLCLVPDVGLDDVFTLSPVYLPFGVSMDNTPYWLMDWVVLDWNVRGDTSRMYP
jgi:hypothetical protein